MNARRYIAGCATGTRADHRGTSRVVSHMHGRAFLILAASIAAILVFSPNRAVAQPTPDFLTATPRTVVVGQPVAFEAMGAVPPVMTGTMVLRFGDGAEQTVPALPQTIAHRYTAPGLKTATLLFVTVGGLTTLLAETTVNVLANQVRVPVGQIVDTVAIGSPALAGGDINLILHYHVTAPLAVTAAGQTALQVVADLIGSDGHLVRRSDPFALFVSPFDQTSIQTAVIPYTVPVDAGGVYQLVLYIRSAQGGTVAVGRPVPLLVVGGADPAPVIKNVVHASGAIVVGPPLAGGTGNGNLNFGMTTALEWPTYALTISGLYDPISHKSDPIFALASSSPGPVSAPDATAPVNPNASRPASTATALPGRLKFSDVVGRAQSALPQFLGGGETLHGIDATYDYTNFIYHAAYGFTQLATATTGERRGGLIDLTRAFSSSDTLRFSLTDNRDDPASFIATGLSTPLDGRTGYLEWSDAFSAHLKGVFSAGRSSTQDLVTGNGLNDAADKVDLLYSLGADNYEFEYHNAGAVFATGGGLGAQADRVGGSLNLGFGLSPISQLGLLFKRDDQRSIFARDASFVGTWTVAPPSGASLTMTLSKDRQLTVNSDSNTDGVTWALQRAYPTANWNVSGAISTLRDALQSNSDSTTRTAAAAYQFRFGPHTLGFGAAGSDVSSGTPTTMFNESVNYGFSFGGVAPSLGNQAAGGGSQPGTAGTRRFELTSQFSNTVTRQPASGGRDVIWNALLSYHVSPQLAPGITFASLRHVDDNPALDTQQSAFRLRLDLNI